MADVKFTKFELRNQQLKLAQLQRYLPTLQLKKAMLQAEVTHAVFELENRMREFHEEKEFAAELSPLLTGSDGTIAVEGAKVLSVEKQVESIAGVEIPHFVSIAFEPVSYSLYETPLWVDDAKHRLQMLATAQNKVHIAQERKQLLEAELREVSIRVNLFEKILIPRAQTNIKKIRVFLGDQALAAVCQAKIAKSKVNR